MDVEGPDLLCKIGTPWGSIGLPWLLCFVETGVSLFATLLALCFTAGRNISESVSCLLLTLITNSNALPESRVVVLLPSKGPTFGLAHGVLHIHRHVEQVNVLSSTCFLSTKHTYGCILKVRRDPL